MKALARDLPYALYLSSIEIGAGVLSMPLTAGALGFLPLLVVTVLVGGVFVLVYYRMADTIFRLVQVETDEHLVALGPALKLAGVSPSGELREKLRPGVRAVVLERGSAVFDALIRRVGLGRAGLATLFLGTLWYVFFADVGYIVTGKESLNAVAGMLRPLPWAPLVANLSGVGLLACSLALPLLLRSDTGGRGAVQKFLAMGGSWLIGLGVLALLDGSTVAVGGATWGSLVGTALFLAAIGAAMFVGRPSAGEGRDGSGLSAQHRVNVLVLLVEFGLLFAAGGAVLVSFAAHGLLEDFRAFGAGWLPPERPAEWSAMLNVVIFAYVGTGIFNICRYPELFESDPGQSQRPRFIRVAVLGTAIPMVVYLGWTLVTSFVLTPGELVDADIARRATHIAIAAKAGRAIPEVLWLVTVLTFLFALMAVTSACVGFTESLSDRISLALRDLDGRREWPADWRLPILAGAALAAVAIDAFSALVNLNVLLAFAGGAGGGLLFLVLPLFLPAHPAPRPVRYWQVAAAVLLVVVLLWTMGNLPGGGPGLTDLVFVAGKVVVFVSVVAVTVWLVFSGPFPSADAPAAGRLPPRA